MRAKGYSLWLMPSAEAYTQINGLITKLSEDLGEQYFEPHITLLGEIMGEKQEIIDKSTKLAREIKPFDIETLNIERGNEYFRRLFILTSEPEELMAASVKSRKVFRREADPKYTPHISLLYSDSSVPESSIRRASNILPMRLTLNSLKLIDANGEPQDWHELKRFGLN